MGLVDDVRIRDLRALVSGASTVRDGMPIIGACAQRVRRLEEHLERSLVAPDGMALTEAGWALLSRAAAVVAAADELIDEHPSAMSQREEDHLVTVACLEWALAAMRRNLTDAQREKAFAIMKQ